MDRRLFLRSVGAAAGAVTDGVRNDIAELQTQQCYLLNAVVSAGGIAFSQSLNEERC